MAVDYNRQYIGARYVPTFFNNPDGSWDWAAGFQYEPLTIVKYGESTYTSKKLVPGNIGSPNLNPNYWALTGNYNGAIVQLQQDINNLQNFDSEWKKRRRKILFIGDSYGEYPNGGWGEPLSGYMSITSFPFTISIGSGEGFYSGWPARLKSISNIDSYTDCYFIGGVNDWGQDNANNGLVECAQYCNLHNINMHIIYLGIRYGQYDTAKDFAMLQSFTAANYGVSYYRDGYKWFHYKDAFETDLLHPTKNSEIYAAKNIFNLVMGGQDVPKRQIVFGNTQDWFSIVTFTTDWLEISSAALNINIPSDITPGSSVTIACPQFIMGRSGYTFDLNLTANNVIYKLTCEPVKNGDNNANLLKLWNLTGETIPSGNKVNFKNNLRLRLPTEFF